MKTCNRCKLEKPREDFYKISGSSYKESWDCRSSVCKSCMSVVTKEKRDLVKKQAVEHLGNKCVDCGLKTEHYEVYDFHHLDPSKKEIAFGASRSRSFSSIKSELDKCVLLCANCHRIKTL